MLLGKFKMVTSQLKSLSILAIMAIIGSVHGQHDPHFTENRTTITHLFEWRWVDIAAECERFLGPYGYAGVQVSPPNENVIAFRVNENGRYVERPWWERYQPVSYKLETRSGTEAEFKDMVQRCNAAGVRIYVDAVINHMTYTDWGEGHGTGGSFYDTGKLQYDGVPYSWTDFNGPAQCPTPDGEIGDRYDDPVIIRNCRLGTLHDLNQGVPWVRDRIVDYMNNLTSFGVAGFRVDASKHMWPEDLKLIYDRLESLPTEHGFPEGARPFIYQEVIDNGGEAISAVDYFELGRVTEFKACARIGNVFRKWGSPSNPEQPEQLSFLENWGEGEQGWGFMPTGFGITFVDNHDNQRGHGAGGASILTFRNDRLYKMAQAFILAWPYGLTRVMSSYYWDQDFVNGKDFNDWIGPPHDAEFNTLPVPVSDPSTDPIEACGDGWICEHRWRQIYNMVRFRNIVQGTAVTNWWADKDRIAFSRDGKGFLAINNDVVPFDAVVTTSLPDGVYCDIISGSYENGKCTSDKTITVFDGQIYVYISETEVDPMLATHIGAKLS